MMEDKSAAESSCVSRKNFLPLFTVRNCQYVGLDFESAVKEGDVTRINELITRENVLKKYPIGDNTLLHIAAKHGTVETVSRLLKFGADVNAKDYYERTPIFYAIKNSEEVVKVLLNHSKVNDWNVFREALIHGTEKIFGLLLYKSLLEITSVQSAISTMNCNFEFYVTETVISVFLQHQLHLDHMRESYPLLIFFAARIGRKDMLHIIETDFSKHVASLILEMIWFKSLFAALRHKVMYVPRIPQELNFQGPYGKTALHHAVEHKLVDAVRFLLEEGADPDCFEDNNFTPLHFAASFEHEEICRLLLGFGANVNPNDGHPENPFNLVCGVGESRLLRKFKNNDLKNSALNFDENFVTFNPKIMKLLLEHGADPDTQSPRKVPVLFECCERGRLEEVQILLQYGANIRAVDRDGNSALHYTAVGSSLKIVDLLLEWGLDIDLKNNTNYTPLMFAVEKKTKSSEMIQYLVGRGSKVNAINSYGQNVVHIAMSNFAPVVECLLEVGADYSILDNDKKYLHFCSLNNSVDERQKVLISFIALRENGFNRNIKFYVEDVSLLVKYYIKSKFETRKLSKKAVSKNCKTSYFDFLTKDFYSSVQIAKKSDLRPFFNSEQHKNQFPCYASLLKYHFEMVCSLENVVDKTFDLILNYTKLPEITEMIMINLSIVDFRILERVFSNK